MKWRLLSSMLLLVPLVAVFGSPVITDLPIVHQIKAIYKESFLIVEASNLDVIYFRYNANETGFTLGNDSQGLAEVLIEGDVAKRSEGFVLETRPSEKGVSPGDFCKEKSEHFPGLNLTCQDGYYVLRSLNADEQEQIEILKTKYAHDQTRGPFKIVHDLQKIDRSPAFRVESSKMEFLQMVIWKDWPDREFFTLTSSELGSYDIFERSITITSKVNTSSFVIDGLPKGNKATSCMSTDLPYEVLECNGPVRIRKIRDDEYRKV